MPVPIPVTIAVTLAATIPETMPGTIPLVPIKGMIPTNQHLPAAGLVLVMVGYLPTVN